MQDIQNNIFKLCRMCCFVYLLCFLLSFSCFKIQKNTKTYKNIFGFKLIFNINWL